MLHSVQATIKIHCRLSGFLTTGTYFSQFWRSNGPRSRRWQIQCLARPVFLGPRQCLLPGPSHGGRGRPLSRASFLRALVPFVRALPPCNLITPNRLHLQIPLSWGLGCRLMNFGGGGHRHTAYSRAVGFSLFHLFFNQVVSKMR